MLSKRLGVLLALAFLPALGQVSDKPASSLTGMELFKLQHGVMKFHAQRLDGSVESNNWSGYAVTGTKFTQAAGSWIVPSVNCTKTPNTYAVFWVGLDGYADTTVEQTGTLAVCSGKTAAYYAWYEFVPNEDIQLISTVAVSPGDKISAAVLYDDPGFTLKITNVTTGNSFSKKGKPTGGAKRESAEWIAEAPTGSSGILPLSNFGTASYGQDSTDVSDTNYASDSTVTGPISDFGSNAKAIIMVTEAAKPKDKAVPSALSTDGSSFTVAWKHE
jgi:hypothetical protein